MPAFAVVAAPPLSRAQPLATFRLTTGEAQVFARAAEVELALWQETFGEQAKDFAYYQLLEKTMSTGFAYRYLVLLSPNEKAFALQPMILVDQDLALAMNGRCARVVQKLRRSFPRLLRSRMLMAGCLVGDGHFGIRKDSSRRAGIAMLAEALGCYAATERISLVAVKDFPSLQRSEMQPLLQAGFFRLDGFPPLQLELNFASFEQYLAQRLSRSTRKNLRRKFRRVAAARPAITLEVRSECREVIDEIYPLYLAVTKRSTVAFEIFSREYFCDLSLTMGERCRFFLWRQGRKIIAFSVCFLHGDTVYDQDLGLDYSVAHALSLYYLTFRDVIEWALHQGYRYYRTAPFNYDPKMHLRLELDPVDLFVRHKSPFLNFLLARVAPFFAPAKSDPVLRHRLPATR